MIKSVLYKQLLVETLTKNQIDLIERQSTITTYAKDQVVFYEDTTPFGVYIILKGKVMLYKTGTQGKRQIFELCSDNDLFGFHAVINDEVYPDSASTLEVTTLQFIPKHVFLEIVKSSPNFSFEIIRALSSEFREFVNFETMLAQKPVRERVAIVLCRLYNFYKGNIDKVIIPLSRNDLADLCGTVKETLVRVLTEFKKSGHIKSVGLKEIEILDPDSLQKIADY